MDRHTHTQTDRPTDANRFYNLSHAICYSYGTDKNKMSRFFMVHCVVMSKLMIQIDLITDSNQFIWEKLEVDTITN